MAHPAVFERFHADGREVRESWRLDRVAAARYLVPLGRALFAFVFLYSAAGHFTRQSVDYAAAQGVPFAGLLVPLTGLILIAGGASVLLGFHARLGGLLLVLFLVPVTLVMHDFWNVAEPVARQVQQGMFLKNLSMLGGALLVTYFGAGPLSLDARDPVRVLPRAPKM